MPAPPRSLRLTGTLDGPRSAGLGSEHRCQRCRFVCRVAYGRACEGSTEVVASQPLVECASAWRTRKSGAAEGTAPLRVAIGIRRQCPLSFPLPCFVRLAVRWALAASRFAFAAALAAHAQPWRPRAPPSRRPWRRRERPSPAALAALTASLTAPPWLQFLPPTASDCATVDTYAPKTRREERSDRRRVRGPRRTGRSALAASSCIGFGRRAPRGPRRQSLVAVVRPGRSRRPRHSSRLRPLSATCSLVGDRRPSALGRRRRSAERRNRTASSTHDAPRDASSSAVPPDSSAAIGAHARRH